MHEIAPNAWIEALDRSLAEIAAGQSFPSSQIMAELTQGPKNWKPIWPINRPHYPRAVPVQRLVEYSPTARQHIIGLRQHYSRLQRPEAIRNLQNSLQDAERRIEQAPHLGLPTPRPYPRLIVEGVRWIKTGPYWVAYTFTTDKILVAGVFHESADIPNRM